MAGGATRALPQGSGLVLLFAASLWLSGCRVIVGGIMERDLRNHKREQAELAAYRSRLVSFGFVAPIEVAGRRFSAGELKLRTTAHLRSEDTGWIVVNFNKAWKEASYQALVRVDCAKNELWIESWETFTATDGVGSVVDSGSPPSPQRLPGHDAFAKVAQRICEERSVHAAVMAFRQGFEQLGHAPTVQIEDRSFRPGRLNVWRDRGPLPHGDRAWIVVNFHRTAWQGDASYGALVRADCQKHELWAEHWTTFAADYGLERVIDRRMLPAPQRLEPAGNETLQATARWICGPSAL